MNPTDEVVTAVQHANTGLEEIKARGACQEDLFARPKTQQELIYDYIKQQGRVFSHELNAFAVQNCINNPGSRARELKAQGKIWRMSDHLMKCLYPKMGEGRFAQI